MEIGYNLLVDAVELGHADSSLFLSQFCQIVDKEQSRHWSKIWVDLAGAARAVEVASTTRQKNVDCPETQRQLIKSAAKYGNKEAHHEPIIGGDNYGGRER